MTSAGCIVITGVSGGVGDALVSLCVKRGFTVIGIDFVNPPDKTKFARFIRCDLADLAQNQKEYARLKKQLDKEVNVTSGNVFLINNAAYQTVGFAREITPFELNRVFSVNVFAPYFLTQILLPHMESRGGSIVNVCSIHSRLTKPRFSAYAASKSALESLTRSLSHELAPYGISVNGVSPAAIDTTMLRAGLAHSNHDLDFLGKLHPAGTIGSAKKLADLIFYILTSRDNFLTGSIVDYTGAISSRLRDIE